MCLSSDEQKSLVPFGLFPLLSSLFLNSKHVKHCICFPRIYMPGPLENKREAMDRRVCVDGEGKDGDGEDGDFMTDWNTGSA